MELAFLGGDPLGQLLTVHRCQRRLIDLGREQRVALDEGVDLARSLQGIKINGVEIIFTSSTEHRGVLVLRGEGLSSAISDTDPHSSQVAPPLESKPLKNTEEARRTSRVVNQFVKRSWEILSSHPLNKEREKEGKLPANIVLTRGAGVYQEVDSLEERYGFRF